MTDLDKVPGIGKGKKQPACEPNRKISAKVERRAAGYDMLVKFSKNGGREYTRPGSRNRKRQG